MAMEFIKKAFLLKEAMENLQLLIHLDYLFMDEPFYQETEWTEMADMEKLIPHSYTVDDLTKRYWIIYCKEEAKQDYQLYVQKCFEELNENPITYNSWLEWNKEEIQERLREEVLDELAYSSDYMDFEWVIEQIKEEFLEIMTELEDGYFDQQDIEDLQAFYREKYAFKGQ